MKKSLTKVLAILSAACLLMTSCGKAPVEQTISSAVIPDENVTAPGELPIVKEKITLKVGVLASSKVEDYETNAFTKYLEEKTNIDIEFYQFPASGGYDKLNVMLASGAELPEVVVGFGLDRGSISKYGANGTFLDLTNYIEEQGYWMKEVYEKTKVENLDGYLNSLDGKKYYMPHIIEQEGNLHGGKAFINKTWLDKLGLKVPETLDEFVSTMEAFKTQDPNGNGKADELGFTGSKDGWNEKPVNFLMNSFVYDDYYQGLMTDKDGKVSLNYQTKEYQEGMQFISGMMAKGLIDPQCYTQTSEILRSICNQDDNVIGAFASGSPDSLFLSGTPRLGEYVALPPLKGPNGKAYALTGVHHVGSSGFITKDCKHPLAAYRLLDFMMSEEASTFCRYGVEGTDWKRADENSVAMFGDLGFEARIIPYLAYGATQNSHWFQLNPAFRSSDISDTMAMEVVDELDGEYFKAKALKAYSGKGPEYIIDQGQVVLDTAEMEEYSSLRTTIKSHVDQSAAQFATGAKAIDDAGWEAFQKELEGLNITRYLELIQKGFDNFNSMAK